jgi:hypothetical protein
MLKKVTDLTSLKRLPDVVAGGLNHAGFPSKVFDRFYSIQEPKKNKNLNKGNFRLIIAQYDIVNIIR